VSADFLRGENLWSLIRTMTVLVHCFLVGDVTFGGDIFLVLSLWWLVRCYKKQVIVAGIFIFCNSSFFFSCVYPYYHLDTTFLQRLCVIGIFMIFIYFLYRKICSDSTVSCHRPLDVSCMCHMRSIQGVYVDM
jgi:hypothetical protein